MFRKLRKFVDDALRRATVSVIGPTEERAMELGYEMKYRRFHPHCVYYGLKEEGVV